MPAAQYDGCIEGGNFNAAGEERGSGVPGRAL